MPVSRDPANGLEKLTLRSEKGATCEVYLHGAHIVSWKDASGRDILFTSKQAIFKPPKAIRGGVPVCFPQFGQLGPLGQHGFARNTNFELESEASNSATLVSASGMGYATHRAKHRTMLCFKLVELVFVLWLGIQSNAAVGLYKLARAVA
eukprot:GHRR01011758.1.p1 GENE.GHRR01011758.1~~GHRR01011758.1.p1  ORF type:complete len:150 (+),score=28.29 GHRR01011758.1:152-601(+)